MFSKAIERERKRERDLFQTAAAVAIKNTHTLKKKQKSRKVEKWKMWKMQEQGERRRQRRRT